MKIFNVGFDRVEVDNSISFEQAFNQRIVLSAMFNEVPTITFEKMKEEHYADWEKEKRKKQSGMNELF